MLGLLSYLFYIKKFIKKTPFSMHLEALCPAGCMKLLQTDYDKINQLCSQMEKMKQRHTFGNVREI